MKLEHLIALRLRFFPLDLLQLEDAFDGDEQLVEEQGLLQKIVGAAFDRLYRHLDCTVAGDHNHRQLRVAALELAEQIYALLLTEHDIQQDQIRALALDQR